MAKEISAATMPRNGVRLRNGLCMATLLRDATQVAVTSDADSLIRAMVHIRWTQASSRFEGYKILEVIGEGGMGIVYLARELTLGRVVALKCMVNGLHRETAARFHREARLAANLDHPNVVPIYSVSETRNHVPFFTMKYASRGSLQAHIADFRHDPRRSVRLLIKVALAVHQAHDRGILHRDIKPANILLDQGDEPLVADFGMARTLGRPNEITCTLSALGTPGYLAPEQARGANRELTPAADVYSLGIVLFELLTGRKPFKGDDVFIILRQANEIGAPRLRAIVPHLDKNLEAICARCLDVRPAARYQSAKALAEDLENWSAGRQITAQIPTAWKRLQDSACRNRRLVASTIAVAALAISLATLALSTFRMFGGTERHSIGILPLINLDNLDTEPISKSTVTDWGRKFSTNKVLLSSIAVDGTSSRFVSPDDIKRIGHASRSEYVLTGSIRLRAGRHHIALRLIDVASGNIQATELFDFPVSASIQGEIGPRLTKLCQRDTLMHSSELQEDPGLENQIARDEILSGRDLTFRYTLTDLEHAIELFRKAIKAEPRSALAHAYLASAAAVRTHYLSDWSYLELAETEARKAVELDPMSPDAHRALAGVYYQQGVFEKAIDEAITGLELHGFDEKSVRFVGMAFQALGRIDRSLDWYSLAFNPPGTPGDMDGLLGDCWTLLGEDNRAFAAYNRAAELQPGCTAAIVGLSHLRLLQKDFDAARHLISSEQSNVHDLGDTAAMQAQVEFFARNFSAARRIYAELAAKDPTGGGSFYSAVSYESALLRCDQMLGEKELQRLSTECLARQQARAYRQPQNAEVHYCCAAVEATLGMRDKACQDLQRAVALGWRDLRSLTLDPRFDAVRSETGYQVAIVNLSHELAETKAKSIRRYNEWSKNIGMN